MSCATIPFVLKKELPSTWRALTKISTDSRKRFLPNRTWVPKNTYTTRLMSSPKKERDTHLEVILRALLPEAFATVKETARRFSNNEELEVSATDHDCNLAARKSYITIDGDKARWKNSWTAAGGEITWNMVHYDVQLIGGMVLHDGKIAEMATGEGKTLVATLPAYLNGLSGMGVHVVTVNDYLARRDSEWIGPFLNICFLPLIVSTITDHIPLRGLPLTTATLLMEPTTNLVLTI